MNKYLKLTFFLIFAIAILVFAYFGYTRWKFSNEIKLFNSMSMVNLDLKICDKLDGEMFKAKCKDNYNSLLAFKKLDYKLCNGILDEGLQYSCVRHILFFKAKKDRNDQPCAESILKKDDSETCKDYVIYENMMSGGTILPDCTKIKSTQVALECQRTKAIFRKN